MAIVLLGKGLGYDVQKVLAFKKKQKLIIFLI